MGTPSSHTFKVRVEEPGCGIITKTVTAAYFQHDDACMVFKDTDNQTVYSVRHANFLSAERVQLCATAESTGA
ncbi:hypothetical protein [Streptantibioticus silvisoli]|uniref:Uncharacterized protein n=1 Tax=Streptantibioticus silvisoli TaxID=2705255 RepID=A0ABT6W7S9_9ACTN|nr:hypothetical protein [Streptantibioticus silvisoli]MDI5965733.1 hypothetical protein [Streptantibioticus silvisoli]